MNRLINKSKSDQGFTLVELLVVIIIIGILAAVAIPAFLNQLQRANDATVESDVKNISIAVESMTAGRPKSAIVLSPDKKSLMADGQSEAISSSPGVSWNVYGSANGYCILGWHANGKAYKETTPLVYDSVKGGIKKGATTCENIPNAPNGSTFSADGTTTEPATYAWLGTPHASPSTATTASGLVRTNLAAYPSMEHPTVWPWGNWSGTDSSATTSRVSDPNAISGNSVVRVTWNQDTSTVNGGVIYHLWNTNSTVAGDTYAASMYVKPSKSQHLTICIEWYDTNVSDRLTIECSETKNIAAGTWERLSIVDTAVPSSDRMKVVVYSRWPGSRWFANDYLEADALLIEKSTTVGAYFDGSTVND